MSNPRINLESMLQAHPATAPVRPNLAATTLQLAVQAKRVRTIKRWLAAAAILSVLLMLAKWLTNDLFYLVQLMFTQAHLLREQANLYTQAIWESLPKAQAATIIVTACLWLAWRRLETSLTHSRITSVKQGPVMKVIKLTPRFAVASALLGTAALGVSGYTYAQKAEQHQLEILRSHINQSGRTQLDTNLAADECNFPKNQNYTNKYEIKKSANISAEDAKQIIMAACRQSAAITYLENHYPSSPPAARADDEAFDEINATGPIQVAGRTGQELVISRSDKHDSQSESLQLSPDVTVYQPGVGKVSLNAIKPGTIVAASIKRHLVRTMHKTEGQGVSAAYDSQSATVIALYVLPSTPDFHWYTMQNLLTQIQFCTGNPEDTCSFTGSIDFFPSGGGEGNVMNPSVVKDYSLSHKEIAGVITEIAPTYTKIKSSSGRLFTINFGSNPAAEFNQGRYKNYNNQKAEVGDTLTVRYVEPKDQHAATIPQNHIFNAVLMIEFVNKSDSLKKY